VSTPQTTNKEVGEGGGGGWWADPLSGRKLIEAQSKPRTEKKNRISSHLTERRTLGRIRKLRRGRIFQEVRRAERRQASWCAHSLKTWRNIEKVSVGGVGLGECHSMCVEVEHPKNRLPERGGWKTKSNTVANRDSIDRGREGRKVSSLGGPSR